MIFKRNDILWKGVLDDLFGDFLRFFFVEADQLFDFDRGFLFLDKALPELLSDQGAQYPRHVNKLVKAYTHEGNETIVLVHVEVRGYSQPDFAERMFTYYCRLLDKYDTDVTVVSIFLGGRTKYNTSFFEWECLGTSIRFDFNTCYVAELDENELRKSKNPFAVVFLTALIALKYKKNADDLFALKIALIKSLFEVGMPMRKIRLLIHFIKLYIRFENNELNFKFDNQIKLLTNKKYEPTGVLEQVQELLKQEIRIEGEKNGKEKGRLEGSNEAKISIAKEFKTLGISADLIAKGTNLSLSQIMLL